MRNGISFVPLGVALAAGISVAHAQTIVTPGPGPVVTGPAPFTVPPSGVLLTQPAPAVPTQTVETERTVRTTTTPTTISRHVTRTRTADRVTTTRTTTLRRDVVAAPVAYDEMMQGPPLYDVVPPAPPVAAPPVMAAVPVAAGAVLPLYRYVYEPDRILVIDPATNIAIQALPR